MLGTTILLSLVFSSSTFAHPLHEVHDHVAGDVLPGRWYHDDDHPVSRLFRRDSDNSLPQVGSDDWRARYPTTRPADEDTPQPWVNAYNKAKAAGKIPSIPPSIQDADGNPSYPGLGKGIDAPICQAAWRVCKTPGDIWDAPTGKIGINFDDGPSHGSPILYDFLAGPGQGLHSTHFMIGTNILSHPDLFLKIYNSGRAQIAVHTWTHPKMSTLSDFAILNELGWTMKIIYESSGRLPKFWRPPTGDSDSRVTAIAREVFGLTNVLWNYDTQDWSLDEVGPLTNATKFNSDVTTWLSGPKSPGLIILEHELTHDSVGFFINTTFPLIQKYSWQPGSIADVVGQPWYQNADGPTSAPSPVGAYTSGNATSAAGGSSPAASGAAPGSLTAGQANKTPSAALPQSQAQWALVVIAAFTAALFLS